MPVVREMFEDQANVIGQFNPNNNASYGNTYNSNWRNHPNFSWKPRAPQYTQPGQAPLQASNIEQAIVNLSKVVRDFVGDQKSINAQLSQRIDSNPKGIHEVEAQEGEYSQMRKVKAVITLRSVQVSTKIQRSGLSYHLSDDWRDVCGESLVGLGASLNLLPYSVYKQLGLGELKPTSITLSLADRSAKIPRGMIEDVLVQVDKFYYLVDFVVLDTDPVAKGTNCIPIILGKTIPSYIKCYHQLFEREFGDLDEGLPEPLDLLAILPPLKMREEILSLFNDEKTQEAIKEEPPKLILKPLSIELKYVYLEENKQSPIVISSSLTTTQEDCLLEILRRCKKAIGWKISDLKGISPLVCSHHIYMEEEAKPVH
ncbi:hypothetical protein CK203_057465 [Vitis vinifera]|uniref:Uncharacterized protein n=1 Tax=Vitis vinifera TaxID=29760 RepID=A0A438GLA0_VITVI|nr:hypothetical protein CK203_057465 [Vitis vinifera]